MSRRMSAQGRRMILGAVAGAVLAFSAGGVVWATAANLALDSAIAGILLLLLPAPGAAIGRGRKRA